MPGARSRTVLGAASALVISVGAAGCGNARTAVPSVTAPSPPSALRTLSFRTLGLQMQAPRNWSVGAGKGALVTTISSGSAIVAVWRYRRSSPPPADPAALAQARMRLIAEARRRDRGLRLLRSGLLHVDGVPAVEIDAVERISGLRRRVRSVHVFRLHGELVLEEYAPVAVFRAVDGSVFAPLKRSLTLNAPSPSSPSSAASAASA